MGIRVPILPLLLAGAAGCTGPIPSETGTGPAGYYSDVASEYEVSGTIPVAATADGTLDGETMVRRLTAVGLYLTVYLTNKFHGIDVNGDGTITSDEVFFHNEGYGGFTAMVRNRSVAVEGIDVDGSGAYLVSFKLNVAGPPDLIAKLPTVETPAGPTFNLVIPKGATVDPDAVPRQDIRTFDPSQVAADQLETIALATRPVPGSSNAYPAYADFFADDVMDIVWYFGHDYTSARDDLAGARKAFAFLEGQGFIAPVATFEELRADSGDFVKVVSTGGRPARIAVRLFHSDMFVGDRAFQHDQALVQLAIADVFIYDGHAGPYYGLYLDGQKEAFISAAELTSAPFQDKQQLFFANGCQTYSQYADALYESETKSEANLDVITTVDFSRGAGTEEFLAGLTRVDEAARHAPLDYFGLVQAINGNTTNLTWPVLYGVIGIDENPQLHPYANPSAIGLACQTAADCGDPNGNACIQALAEGWTKTCGVVAVSPAACPAGTNFLAYMQEGGTTATGCF